MRNLTTEPYSSPAPSPSSFHLMSCAGGAVISPSKVRSNDVAISLMLWRYRTHATFFPITLPKKVISCEAIPKNSKPLIFKQFGENELLSTGTSYVHDSSVKLPFLPSIQHIDFYSTKVDNNFVLLKAKRRRITLEEAITLIGNEPKRKAASKSHNRHSDPSIPKVYSLWCVCRVSYLWVT